MHARKSAGIPCLLWPFWAVWKLMTTLFGLLGRLAAFAIGVALMIVGGVLTITVVGAFVGIPLALVGLLLVMRSLF
jgi:hypothetical protein